MPYGLIFQSETQTDSQIKFCASVYNLSNDHTLVVLWLFQNTGSIDISL